jgi:hypothetical protein
MNKRIEELARQVGFNEYILENVWAHEQPEFYKLLEKFAEAIVQECCSTGEQWADGLFDMQHYNHYAFVNTKIKQYFGVK